MATRSLAWIIVGVLSVFCSTSEVWARCENLEDPSLYELCSVFDAANRGRSCKNLHGKALKESRAELLCEALSDTRNLSGCEEGGQFGSPRYQICESIRKGLDSEWTPEANSNVGIPSLIAFGDYIRQTHPYFLVLREFTRRKLEVAGQIHSQFGYSKSLPFYSLVRRLAESLYIRFPTDRDGNLISVNQWILFSFDIMNRLETVGPELISTIAESTESLKIVHQLRRAVINEGILPCSIGIRPSGELYLVLDRVRMGQKWVNLRRARTHENFEQLILLRYPKLLSQLGVEGIQVSNLTYLRFNSEYFTKTTAGNFQNIIRPYYQFDLSYLSNVLRREQSIGFDGYSVDWVRVDVAKKLMLLLEGLHNDGILHRDVTLENFGVQLQPDGAVRLDWNSLDSLGVATSIASSNGIPVNVVLGLGIKSDLSQAGDLLFSLAGSKYPVDRPLAMHLIDFVFTLLKSPTFPTHLLAGGILRELNSLSFSESGFLLGSWVGERVLADLDRLGSVN